MPHVKTIQRQHVRLPRPRPVEPGLDWGASGWAGLIAGGAFVLIQTFAGAVFSGGGRTEAVRRLASVALGRSVLPPEGEFTALIFFAAAVVHIPLSLIYARLLAAMIGRLSLGRALAAGALFGFALYFVNYYALSGFFPWFVSDRGPAAIIAHLAFGLLAAGVYKSMTRRGP